LHSTKLSPIVVIKIISTNIGLYSGYVPISTFRKFFTLNTVRALVSKISDLCGPDPTTSQTDGRTDGQTDRQTDRRHAISIPRFAL